MGGSVDKLLLPLGTGPDVVMVQEHKLLPHQIPGIVRRLLKLGWHGVWHPALKTGDHVASKSGGVAILVKTSVLIVRSTMPSTHRQIHAVVPWSRRRSLHLFCVHLYDASYSQRSQLNKPVLTRVQGAIQEIGRVLWALGGDS